jgi:transposase
VTKWAACSRLNPFRTLAKTIRQHWDGILAYFDTHMTSAAIEAVNGVIQLAKRMARGFENFVYFRTAAYHRAGKLTLAVPPMPLRCFVWVVLRLGHGWDS